MIFNYKRQMFFTVILPLAIAWQIVVIILAPLVRFLKKLYYVAFSCIFFMGYNQYYYMEYLVIFAICEFFLQCICNILQCLYSFIFCIYCTFVRNFLQSFTICLASILLIDKFYLQPLFAMLM
jgi:hypothetical protein